MWPKNKKRAKKKKKKAARGKKIYYFQRSNKTDCCLFTLKYRRKETIGSLKFKKSGREGEGREGWKEGI